MDLENAKKLIQENGFSISSESVLNQGHGTQLKLSNGVSVCIYNTGKCVIQGKADEKTKVEKIFQGCEISKTTSAINSKDIFVVYGHDTTIRSEWEATLRRWGLNPLILDQIPSEGSTIIEKLIKYKENISFAVVIATPDDWGYKDGHEEEKKQRARQNVVLELGMMLATLGRSRVAILIKNPSVMEKPSDIDGLIYISLDNFSEAKLKLAQEMNKSGIGIDLGKI